jgi:beta-lactamase regulating signal transducer with metallopeptidase domain
MTALFITILNMSITASVVVLAVMLVRIPMKKAPKIFSYALWGVVLFRLICPFSIEGIFSLMPTSTNAIPQDIVYSQNPAIQTGVEFIDTPVNTVINNVLPPVRQSSPAEQSNNKPEYARNEIPFTPKNSPIQTVFSISGYIWLFVFTVLLLYATIGYIRLKRRVYYATLVHDNIFETDKIKTPFVLGFICPKIYIPIGIDPSQHDYILKHEQTHIKRRDYLIKPFAFIIYALHWFNPLMWAAYFLMSKDIEMSCDEAVLQNSDKDIRGVYSSSLLNLSVKRGSLLSPLAFGESDVKSRVQNVINFKKPSKVIVIVAITLVTVFSAGFAVNGKSEYIALKNTDTLQNSILLNNEIPSEAANVAANTDIGNVIEIKENQIFYPQSSKSVDGIEKVEPGEVITAEMPEVLISVRHDDERKHTKQEWKDILAQIERGEVMWED